MTDLIESWESDARIRGMVPETIRGYRWSLRNFEKFVKASRTDLARADKMILRAYIEDLRKRDLAPRTISLRIGAISHLFEFMIFEGLRETNPVIEVRKRYLKNYKTDGEQHERKLISIEEAARMVNACVDARDKAILLVLFKTGIRRGELLALELEDINLQEQSILLKPTKKRSNRLVFFDDETAFYLRRWLQIRSSRMPNSNALWISTAGKRIGRGAVEYIISKAAEQAGVHDPGSHRAEDHFTPHCTRHWNATWLSRSRMEERYIEWLRGDAPRGSIGTYIHIDPVDVKKSYLAHIPQLGV